MISPDDVRNLNNGQLKNLQAQVSQEMKKRKRLSQTINRTPPKDDGPIDMEAFSINSSEVRSLPFLSKSVSKRSPYFKALICQDWSDLYPRDTDFGPYYVYAHVQPFGHKFSQKKEFGGDFQGMPFYIGKGVGDRAFNLKRNEGHGVRLRKLLRDGFLPDDIVHIAFDGLSEQKAFEIEAKLIYFFGGMFDRERRNGLLVNLDIPKVPMFPEEMVKEKTHNRSKSNKRELLL